MPIVDLGVQRVIRERFCIGQWRARGALAEKQKGGFDDRLFASGWIALVVLIIRIAIREDEWQYAGSLFANRIKPGGVDA